MCVMSAELFAAIKAGDRPTVERLLGADRRLASARDENGVSAVLIAIYYHEPAIAQRILAERPPLDVFEAAAVGDAARLRALVDADAAAVNAHAADGFTALGLAAFFRRPEAVRVLLERGADPAIAARNRLAVTPLHSAVATDAAPVDLSIVRMLLEAGAPVNVPHLGGGTPLHTAAFSGDMRIVRMLLERGADPRLRLDDGKNAIDIARERGHATLADMLEGGARPA